MRVIVRKYPGETGNCAGLWEMQKACDLKAQVYVQIRNGQVFGTFSDQRAPQGVGS